jgi:hypothetical protein
MSFLSKSLPDNVSFYAQKYIINSMIASLKNIYSYNASGTVDFFNHKKIFYSKFKMNLNTKLINCNFKNKKIKFYTINREEKIMDGVFLNCVKEILEKFPESTFSYTGKKKIEFIENFFKQHNLEQRVFFLNWINIDEFGLKHGDIFLDTTNLSGLIAAKSFSSGIPTIFFNNSTFWLNSFIDEIKNDDSYSFIEQEIINDWYKNLEDYKSSYLNIVYKISTIENYFNNYINLSIKLSKKYFTSLRNKKEANLLFENMIT